MIVVKRKKGAYGSLIGWPDFAEASTNEMFEAVWSELGKSLIYMDFMNTPAKMWDSQRPRVHKLCRKFAKNWHARRWPDSKRNRLWWRKLLSDISDEIENQC